MWILETGSCPVSLLLAPYSSFCSLQPCIWALVSPLLRLLIACWTKSTLFKVACNVLHDFIFACLSKPPPQLPLLARIQLHWLPLFPLRYHVLSVLQRFFHMLCAWGTPSPSLPDPPHHSGLSLHITSSQKPALMLQVWERSPSYVYPVPPPLSQLSSHGREIYLLTCPCPPPACKFLEGRDVHCGISLLRVVLGMWMVFNKHWLDEWMNEWSDSFI